MASNKLHIIGVTGNAKAYLNVTKEEAIKRYAESEDTTVEEAEDRYIKQIDFTDEFGVYYAWDNS